MSVFSVSICMCTSLVKGIGGGSSYSVAPVTLHLDICVSSSTSQHPYVLLQLFVSISPQVCVLFHILSFKHANIKVCISPVNFEWSEKLECSHGGCQGKAPVTHITTVVEELALV